ncbi:MAG: hypothetical protein QG637_827 [Chloroflexota bacterium]|nr:hypothetical protein [Chloroflexota bacterium]
MRGLVPFEQAELILQEIGQANISRCRIWRRTELWGAQRKAQEEAERVPANALPEKGQPPSRKGVADQRMGVAMDGLMAHIRKEGWKELKVGAVFDIAMRLGRDAQTHEPAPMAHAAPNSDTAHLGGPEVFGEMAFAEAHRRGWAQAQDTAVVADGAAWIWNLADLHFGQSRQLVDWYHADQHLAHAAKLFKGESTPAFQIWFNSQQTALYQGQADRIADKLAQAASEMPQVADDLCREAGYFREHQRRMNYLEMREEEFVIGSGMIEGAAKQYQARLCGAGMRGSRTGAANLIPVRTAILSGRFADVWRKVYNSPPS